MTGTSTRSATNRTVSVAVAAGSVYFGTPFVRLPVVRWGTVGVDVFALGDVDPDGKRGVCSGQSLADDCRAVVVQPHAIDDTAVLTQPEHSWPCVARLWDGRNTADFGEAKTQ